MMFRWFPLASRAIAFALPVASVALAPAGAAAQSPAEVRAGYTRLALVAEGLRTDQLGGDTLYSIAVYAAEPGKLDVGAVARPDTAKALRIEILSDDDPFSPLTRPWRRELVPRLDVAAATHLRAITAPMRKGDVLLVAYEPGKGTTIHGNELTVTTRAPHGLMIAFLDQWIGQRPVSEDLKRTLIGYRGDRDGPA